MNRRKLLQAAGGVSALGAITGSATADTRQQTHEICINAPSNRLYPYQFAVSGTIEKLENVTHAPYRDDVVTTDAEDDIDGTGCRVHGAVQGGVDCYQFTGNIVAFTVPEQWEGNYTIHTNGYERPASELQTQQDPSEVSCGTSGESTEEDQQGSGGTFCELKNSVTFSKYSTNEQRPQFDIAVTGELELPSGQRVQSARRELPGPSGQVAMELPYSGEVEHLSVSGKVKVILDQRDDCK